MEEVAGHRGDDLVLVRSPRAGPVPAAFPRPAGYFELDTSKVEPAPTGPGTVVAAKAQLITEARECPGEVLAFTQDGYLSGLEVCSRDDEIEVTLAAARHSLQPRS